MQRSIKPILRTIFYMLAHFFILLKKTLMHPKLLISLLSALAAGILSQFLVYMEKLPAVSLALKFVFVFFVLQFTYYLVKLLLKNTKVK